jgi:hypothetical protein
MRDVGCLHGNDDVRTVAAVSEALIGLLGAVVGATAAIGTAVLVEWRRVRAEDRRWLRGKVEEAYDSALHHLLRVEGMGLSEFQVESGALIPVMGKEAMPRWFDALVDARYSLHRLLVYCSDGSRGEIYEAEKRVSDAASGLLTGSAGAAMTGLRDLSEVRTTVIRCATHDLREGKAF